MCAAAVEERGHLYGRMGRITIARRCGSNLRNSSNSEPSVGESETIIKRRMSSPELVRREYADLRLNDNIVSEVGHVRIRQHVNPLSSSSMVPSQVPEWKEVYRDTTLPLMVDIGCGSGRFLLWLAKNSTDEKNYLGLEIRHKLVQRAQSWVEELALTNIHFMFANANVSFEQLVFTYPGPLVLVSILCPDPYFKQRHHKRRVVQKPLVQSISRNLHPGGHVFLQSDVLDVAIDMRDQFDALADVFEHVNNYLDLDVPCDKEGWLLSNPLGIRTEREIHAESEGSQIYRRMYQKRA
ncbi:tRNA (guanine-N(7)-)-methyltransferase [Acorus calamus]|uniref:tRNA (guanine(46)-N(7))-methyltransferase n=1 Tax=Acorus calamus TaxID=4465 RepID=A0AAV9C926_ACOCL|nr:tRNA (guanine-N(7)-)-methyltransferase [Acorus calamus]